jgi:hypothetical protein
MQTLLLALTLVLRFLKLALRATQRLPAAPPARRRRDRGSLAGGVRRRPAARRGARRL